MGFPKPRYSNSAINRAGKTMLAYITVPDKQWGTEERRAMAIISNFRSCHGYPINTFQATLRNRLAFIDNSALVMQRLKRLPSILLKLNRFKGMQLSRMQDIGGLRAVTSSLKKAYMLKGSYLESCRVRVANQLALLNIFISGSTVRNILNQPKLPAGPKSSAKATKMEEEKARSIPAWYPNHVWSIDTTMVFCWGLWPIHICVVIDHFSRKVMATAPLEGPNAGWINNALESAIEKYGRPKHIISDQAHVFTGEVFAELLGKYNIKPRLGAIGKHGSVAVTERVNKTLKYEWLKRVAIIKGIDHLTELCNEFELWYNRWRPHMTLDGMRPDDVYFNNKPDKPERDAKTAPTNIEQHYFCHTRITGYRLTKAA